MFIIHLGVKNTFKNWKKFVAIVIMLSIATSFVGIAPSFVEPLREGVDKSLSEDRFDAYILFQRDYCEEAISKDDVKKIADVKGVGAICLYMNEFFLYSNNCSTDDFNAINSCSIGGLCLRDEDRDFFGFNENGEGILLAENYGSDNYTYYLGGKKGEEISFRTATNLDEVSTFRILGYYTDYLSDSESYAFFTENLFYKHNETVSNKDIYSGRVYSDGSVSMQKLVKILTKMGYNCCVAGGEKAFLVRFLDFFQSTTVTMALVCFALVFFLLYKELKNSIVKREKSIGIMKAFGYSDESLCMIPFVELVIYEGVSYVIALVFSVFELTIVREWAYDSFGLQIGRYNVYGMVYMAIVLFIFLVISMIRPIFLVKKNSAYEILIDRR